MQLQIGAVYNRNGWSYVTVFPLIFIADDNRIEIPTAPPQILSKLFPQTSAQADDDEKKQEEQQYKEEEDKKEQENAWKRMKLG